ncbi:MAG: hypothetical protein LBF43_04085 [Puniceicoccales bacterium]|jgi:DUF1365 family protein|nr:hypothetical protein [Puniceicoccales bacterium]
MDHRLTCIGIGTYLRPGSHFRGLRAFFCYALSTLHHYLRLLVMAVHRQWPGQRHVYMLTPKENLKAAE